MKFEDFLQECYDEVGEECWINIDFDDPFLDLDEAVIHVYSQSYMDILDHTSFHSRIFNCKTNSDFIIVLNKAFKSRNVLFIQKGNRFGSTTDKSGIIKIFVDHDYFKSYNTDIIKFKSKLKNILNHELVHREQSKKVNWIKYKGSLNIVNKKKYPANKQEIMAYANTIVEMLYKKYFSDKNVLDFLRTPIRGNKIFDEYIDLFGSDSKEMKLLYKYMYEYIVTRD